MIIHNIDDFCDDLEYDMDVWHEIDSINNIVFNIPYDKVNEIHDSTIGKWFYNLLFRNYRIIDNTAGNIFSNNIDIWKNIDDSRFIENSGQCFGAIQLINDLLDEKSSMQKSLYDYYYETLVYNSEEDDSMREHFYRVVSDSKVKLYLFKFHNFLPGIESILEDLDMHNRLNKQFMNITDKELEAMDFDLDYQ